MLFPAGTDDSSHRTSSLQTIGDDEITLRVWAELTVFPTYGWILNPKHDQPFVGPERYPNDLTDTHFVAHRGWFNPHYLPHFQMLGIYPHNIHILSSYRSIDP